MLVAIALCTISSVIHAHIEVGSNCEVIPHAILGSDLKGILQIFG